MEWKTLIAVIGLVSLCFLAIPIKIEPQTGAHDLKLFKQYVESYNKTYRHSPEEYDRRFQRFQRSLRRIEEMNAIRKTNESARYGLTEYSDMSEEEFSKVHLRNDLSSRSVRHLHHSHHHSHRNDKKLYNNDNNNNNRLRRSTAAAAGKTIVNNPARFDWRDKGFVTKVRSQGSCGACWAFSTVEVVETMSAIKNGTLYSLSVQEMIDCAGNSNFGCNGGDICSLLMWLESTRVKIQSESVYPMTWKTDLCQLNKETSAGSSTSTVSTIGVRIKDFTCDDYIDAEESLMSVIANHGPVAVAVNALSWQNYLGGIIQFHCDGSFKSLNHAVQIVGYDKTGPVPFYIVRNSWGERFGDNGYLYIAAYGNLCGIANQVSSLNVI